MNYLISKAITILCLQDEQCTDGVQGYSVCTLQFCCFTMFNPYSVHSQIINKQIVNIADENLTDYSFLSRYHYIKSKNYLKRRYRNRLSVPMFIGTPLKGKGYNVEHYLKYH